MPKDNDLTCDNVALFIFYESLRFKFCSHFFSPYVSYNLSLEWNSALLPSMSNKPPTPPPNSNMHACTQRYWWALYPFGFCQWLFQIRAPTTSFVKFTFLPAKLSNKLYFAYIGCSGNFCVFLPWLLIVFFKMDFVFSKSGRIASFAHLLFLIHACYCLPTMPRK